MNEDLSSMIERALLYASPLPVTTADEVMKTSDAGFNVSVTLMSQNEHTVSSDSQFSNLSHLDRVEFPVSMYRGGDETVYEATYTKVLNEENVKDSAIEKYIDDTLEVQNADFFARKVQYVGIEHNDMDAANSSIFQNSASETSLAQSEAMVTPVLVLPVQTCTDITHASLSVPGETPILLQEESQANDVSLEKSCSLSIEGQPNNNPKPKKKRKREKNSDPRPEPFLPPCIICHDKSSGFHYGANTCEACKAFFRRTQKTQKVRFKCKCKLNEREEWKREPIKNGCPACRYERCLMVGMSKNAIKIGRYTLTHKTKNINVIKSVESTDYVQDNAMSPVVESSPSSSSGLDLGLSTPENVSSPAGVERSEFSKSSHIAPHDLFRDGRSSSQWTNNPESTKNEVLPLKEIESIVKTLTEAQTRVPFDDTFRIPIEVIKQKQTEYLEKYKLKTELFGDMGLSKEEFTEFYNITGIDLDGRIQHMDGAFQFFEQKISLVVAFAKSIPEFRKLKVDDQANLIKASRIENMLFSGFKNMLRNFDTVKRIVTTPWGKEIHMDELARLIPIDFLLMKLKYAERIQALNLTVQEESVIRGIVTLFSDRCIVLEPRKVEQIQEKLVACLQHLLNVRPGGAGTLLYKIFNLITNLRNFTENETEVTKKMLVEWPMLSANKYQLLKEFLT